MYTPIKILPSLHTNLLRAKMNGTQQIQHFNFKIQLSRIEKKSSLTFAHCSDACLVLGEAEELATGDKVYSKLIL